MPNDQLFICPRWLHEAYRSSMVTVRPLPDRDRYLKCLQRVSLPDARPRAAMHCALWNVRSLSADTPAAICDSIETTSRDVFVAVEAWHDNTLMLALALACPPGYCVVEQARPRSTQLNDCYQPRCHRGVLQIDCDSEPCCST